MGKLVKYLFCFFSFFMIFFGIGIYMVNYRIRRWVSDDSQEDISMKDAFLTELEPTSQLERA